jgi:hypothetical protein
MTISRGAVETDSGSVVDAHDTNPLAIKHTRNIRPPWRMAAFASALVLVFASASAPAFAPAIMEK